MTAIFAFDESNINTDNATSRIGPNLISHVVSHLNEYMLAIDYIVQWNKDLLLLPYIDLLRTQFISDHFRSHPGDSSSKRHTGTSIGPLSARTEVRYFHDVITSNEHAERQIKSNSKEYFYILKRQ